MNLLEPIGDVREAFAKALFQCSLQLFLDGGAHGFKPGFVVGAQPLQAFGHRTAQGVLRLGRRVGQRLHIGLQQVCQNAHGVADLVAQADGKLAGCAGEFLEPAVNGGAVLGQRDLHGIAKGQDSLADFPPQFTTAVLGFASSPLFAIAYRGLGALGENGDALEAGHQVACEAFTPCSRQPDAEENHETKRQQRDGQVDVKQQFHPGQPARFDCARMSFSTCDAAEGMFVPGPKIAAAPAARSAS